MYIILHYPPHHQPSLPPPPPSTQGLLLTWMSRASPKGCADLLSTLLAGRVSAKLIIVISFAETRRVNNDGPPYQHSFSLLSRTPMSPNPYIDDRAEEVPDAEMTDGPSDSESDSEEVCLRRQDHEVFKMPEILATHEERLREACPYRIPTHLLPSGAATPAYHEDQLDIPSHAPSPTIPQFPPLCQCTPLFLADPDSRGPTPFSQRGESWGPTPAVPQLRLQTPLFHDPPVPARSPTPGANGVAWMEYHNSKRPPASDPASDPDTEREDDERSTNSGPLPRKKLKTSHFKALAFLDLAAELSGDDDDSGDDQNEDEETLSDKEFLDDEPVHDVPAASSRPVADDSDNDGDELCTIAQHYEDAAARELAVLQYARPAAPVAPRPPIPLAAGSWIRHRDELSLVVSSRELLQVKDRKFKKKTVKNDLTDKTHRPIFPIHEQTEPFRLAKSQGSHPSIAKTAFVGLCPALTPGDRMVVVSGEFQHKMSQLYIWSLREVLRDNKRVRMAKIAEFNDGRNKLGRFKVEVWHLKRHILDVFCPIQMHDHVCVMSGVLHRGLSGRVNSSLPSTCATLRGTCGAEMWSASFAGSSQDLLGSLCTLGWAGRLKYGMPREVRIRLMFLLLWNTENLSDEVQAQLLPVCAQNVELVDYQMAVYSVSYTRTSEVGAWGPPETAPTKPDDPERERLLNKYNELRAPSDNEKTRKEFQDRYISKITELSQRLAIPLTAADMNNIARVAKKFGQPLTAADRNDFAEISKRLGLLLTAGDGIILTVRKEASNQQILVPIEDAQHLTRNLPEAVLKGNRPKREPPPQVVDNVYLQGPLEPAVQEHHPKLDMPLAGEGDGTWVQAPEFRHVRIDVRLSGLNTIPKVSTKILKLEGHNGYRLAVDGVEWDKSNNDKIVVRGAGNTGVPVSIPPACVKPRRTDDDNHRLNEVQLRGVVVGPDQVGSTAEKGKYGFTVPARLTAELVEVQFPVTSTYNFVETPVPAILVKLRALNQAPVFKPLNWSFLHFHHQARVYGSVVSSPLRLWTFQARGEMPLQF
ncbi:hypothetical protein B0H16DRAFT_1480286 [Mycena metata]|uniref:Uncharacterized protein n=1 Tax=Mycena metata TaxID=1033252 RepID=A0AAD7MDC9_9AGAR|nr:hypothetical protein B0H16DRAFT_1480286 [Mycena metata]